MLNQEELREIQIIEQIEKYRRWYGRPRVDLSQLKDFYPTDLIYFLREANHIELRKYQLQLACRMIKSTFYQRGLRTFALWARGSGKTETIVDAVYFMAVAFPSVYRLPFTQDGFHIGIFSPIQKQAVSNLYDRVRNRIREFLSLEIMDLEADLDNADRMRLSNGTATATITSLSATKEAHVEGGHFHIIVVDETQDIPDIRMKKSIYGSGVAKNATRVMLGSSTPEHRSFFLESLSNAHHEEKIIINAYQAMEQMNFEDRRNYEAYVEKMKKELGEDSIEFRTQFLCEIVTSRNNLIELADLTRHATGKRCAQMFDKECFAGQDAGKLHDSSVTTIVDGNGNILNWLEIKDLDYDKQAESIKNFLNNYRIVKIVVDRSGEGSGLADILFGMGLPVEKVFMSPEVSDDCYRKIRHKFSSPNFIYPKDECIERFKFEKQFSSLQCKYKNGLFLPDKSQSGHDDYCDSYALALKAAEQPDAGIICQYKAGKKYGTFQKEV